jgi:hypothetical protein
LKKVQCQAETAKTGVAPETKLPFGRDYIENREDT